jgi:opacity protein-like surface antigen
MRIWKALVAATPLLITAAPASAAPSAPRWYVSLQAGEANSEYTGTVTDYACPSNLCGFQVPYPIGSEVTGETETAFAAFGAVGVRLDRFRIEAEVGHYSNDVTGRSNDTNVTTTSVMANVLYDIPVVDRLSLSLGAGIGLADIDWKTDNGLLVSDVSAVTFAFQGIAEAAFELTDRISLFAAYRFIDVPDPSLSNAAHANDNVLFATIDPSDIQTQAVSAGIRFDLN